MGDPATPKPAHRRNAAGWIVVIAATLPHLWTFGLSFAKDDYGVIAGASRDLLLVDDYPKPDFALVDSDVGLAPEVVAGKRAAISADAYLCRPVFSAWNYALTTCGGGRARPAIFRAAALVAHGLAAWLLYRLLIAFVPPFGAVVGAIWFGLFPSAHQAISWTAANGDLLSFVFALLGLHLWLAGAKRRGEGGAIFDVGGAISMGLACGAKESAAALVLVCGGVYLLAAPKDGRRTLRCALLSLVAVAGVAAWRAQVLGDWIPRYPGERSAGLDAMRRLPALFGQMIAPWNRAPIFDDAAPALVRLAGSIGPVSAPVVRLFAASCAIPLLAGLVFGGRRGLLQAATAAAAAVLLVLPAAAYVFRDEGGFMLSRNVYHAHGACAALIGIAAAGFARCNPFVRGAFLLPLGLWAIDAATHVARVELRGAAEIRLRLDDVRAIVDAEPAGTRVVVWDFEDDLPGAIPLVGLGYAQAFSSLFTDRPAPVERWVLFNYSRASDLAADESRRVRFAVLDVLGDRRIKPFGGALPAPATDLSLAADPKSVGTWIPVGAIPTRSVASIRFASVPENANAQIKIRTRPERVEKRRPWLERPLVRLDSLDGAVAFPPYDADFIVGRELASVEAVGFDSARPPEIVSTIPLVEILACDRTVVAGAAPTIVFRPPFQTPRYRFVFQFHVGDFGPETSYDVPRERLERTEDGAYRWRARPDDVVEPTVYFPGPFRIEDVATPSGEHLMRDPKGTTVRVRVEGRVEDSRASRSSWAAFRLVKNPSK